MEDQNRGVAYAIDDRDGREVLAYHWQEGMAPPYPHLHLGRGAGVGALVQKRYHLATRWADVPLRLNRISELLAAEPRLDLDDVAAVQLDLRQGAVASGPRPMGRTREGPDTRPARRRSSP